jgi:uroporphyrinogen decarboxylase
MITSLQNDSFLRACRGKEAEFTPVWFMRQAGRYLDSYRKVRAKHDVLTLCKTPELSASVTVDAAKQLAVDAAIMFADIMLPLEGVGIGLKIEDKVGPLIDNPVRDEEQLERIASFVPEEHVPHVLDAIRLVKSRLDDSIPLIGFSGAPFTLASYLIEGGPSRDFTETKKLMYSQPDLWTNLLNGLSKMVSNYLRAQIRAGVDAVQCSIVGLAASLPQTTNSSCCPTQRGSSSNFRQLDCLESTSEWAPRASSKRWEGRGLTSTVWTGEFQ